MMNWIWVAMIILSFVTAIFTGNMAALSGSVMDGAKSAVELIITIGGMIILWSGLMHLAEVTGLTERISKLLYPLIKLIYPGIRNNKPAQQAVAMNMSANLLGLGNAATPLGIKAIEEMQKDTADKKIATNDMAMLVVMNTASIQLLPTTLAALRQAAGAVNPLDILPAVWIASVISVLAGIFIAKVLEKIVK